MSDENFMWVMRLMARTYGSVMLFGLIGDCFGYAQFGVGFGVATALWLTCELQRQERGLSINGNASDKSSKPSEAVGSIPTDSIQENKGNI